MTRIKRLKDVIGAGCDLNAAIQAFREGRVLYDGRGNKILNECELYSVTPWEVLVRVEEPAGSEVTAAAEVQPAQGPATTPCGVCGTPLVQANILSGEVIHYCSRCKNCDWPTPRVPVQGGLTRRHTIQLECKSGVCRLSEA